MVTKKFFLFSLCLIIFSCSKSEDKQELSENGKTIISSDKIENADVNASDFWDETELVWQDEFNGNSLSDDKWLFETYKSGFFENITELQDNVSEDVTEVSDGTLKIFAKKIGVGQNPSDYISARLNGKFTFKYGRLEVRAKLPKNHGPGIMARLWMLGNNIGSVGFPECGEIDFMNYYSYLPDEYYNTTYTSAFIKENGQPATSGAIALPSIDEEFHTYGLLFTDEYLKLYRDDINNITFVYNKPINANNSNWPFGQPFYFILNMVVGGEFAGVEGVDDSIFPSVMEIDYVRVYHPK